MLAGHFGLATIIKARKTKLPLYLLIIATLLLDILFLPLWFFGIEELVLLGSGGYGEQIIHADYTHSLVGSLIIAMISGFIVTRIWNKKKGYMFALVVFSHWILDLIVHRMDMPIFPGNWCNLPLLGFGIWQFPSLSRLIELALIVVGIVLYGNFIFKERTPENQAPKKTSKKWLTVLLVASFLLTITWATI